MDFNSLFIENNLPEPLSNQQIYEYFKKYELGDMEAKKQIILHNTRLVLNVALKYSSMPYELKELIAVGMLGLTKSVDAFDINKNSCFSTYAGVGIENAICAFMKKSRKSIYDVSLDELTSCSELRDGSSDFTDDFGKQEVYMAIRKFVDELPDRERKVVELYFGFINDEVYSQKEIAEMLDVTQSYVSRLVNQSIYKIGKKLLKEGLIERNQKMFAKEKRIMR